MARMGIFTTLQGVGSFGLGETPGEQFAAACRQRCASESQEGLESQGYATAADCQAGCNKFVANAEKCGPACAQHRPDSNEWLYCIQKCHGLTPSQAYDEAQKQGCAAKGMTYSWIESKCVDTKAYNSCPSGTIYATYSDGSSKCIGINSDLSKTTCPAGTTLTKVPSPDGRAPAGVACVSPVKPTVPAKPPVPIKPGGPIPFVDGGGGGGGATLAGMGTGWLLVGAGALALLGIVYMAKKKKQAALVKARANRRRRRRH